MDILSKDILCLIALRLKGKDISSFCNSSKRITQLVERNTTFWINKILKERPNFLATFKDKVKLLEYRSLYNKLSVSNSKIYELCFENKSVNVKGKFKNYLDKDEKDCFYYEYLGNFLSNKLTRENWAIVSGKKRKTAIGNNAKDIVQYINTKCKPSQKTNEEEISQCCNLLKNTTNTFFQIDSEVGYDIVLETIEIV